jgi:hypothetical protein
MSFIRAPWALLLWALPMSACPPTAAQPASAPRAAEAAYDGGTPRCEAQMRALTERGFALTRRSLEHRRFAEDHDAKYKLEIATCELAKKSQSRPQLEACVALLDRAEARAREGNRIGDQIGRETAALQAASAEHNRRCPLHQVRVVAQ